MKKSGRYLSVILAGLLILTVVSINSPKAYASSAVPRLAGTDRYSTAVSIAVQGWQKSDNVVLATGEDYPDALCAAPLARKLSAPILLTEKQAIRKDVYDELKSLGAKNIYIVGGPGVVSPDIENRLKVDGMKVVRLYGADRYETSLKVANYMADNLGMNITGVMVTTGEDFPDALSSAPVAAVKGMPILLSPKDSMTNGLLSFVKDRNIKNEYVIGGPGVISSAAFAQLPNPERIWGRDRYETNASVLYRFKDTISFDTAYVATGEDFPDALAGSALAPKTSSPVILTYSDPAPSTMDLLNLKRPFIGKAYALGGTGVVSDKTLDSLFVLRANTSGNSLSNINNFGTASLQDGWIYYSDFSDNQNLYKMKSDGTSVTKLTSEGGISHISVLGSYVYYSSNEGKFSRISTQGGTSSTIINDEVYFLYASSDWIYFYSQGALWKIKPDGSGDKIKIIESDDLWNYYIDGGYVYFVENGSLMKVKTDGSGKVPVIGGDVQYFNISQGFIYYISVDQKLYSVNMNGTDRKQISGDYAGNINVTGNWIYYSNISDNDSLYKIAVDGTSRTKLGDTSIYGGINVIGDSLFCSDISTSYAINKMDSNGGSKAKIGSGMGYSFKFSDGWIYYVNITDGDHIYRMKPDGTGLKSYDASSTEEIGLSGGWIYYSSGEDNNKLYRISIDGNSKEKVLDKPVGDFEVSGGIIYYSDMSDGNKLYKIDTNTPGQPVKMEDNPARNIIVYNGWVYYFDEGVLAEGSDGTETPSGYGIYRIGVGVSGDSSLSPDLLAPAYIDSMSISNGYLLYHDIDNTGSGRVYRAGLDGTGNTMVTDGSLAFAADGSDIYSIGRDNQNIITKYYYSGSKAQSYSISGPSYYISADLGWIYYETVNSEIKLYQVSIFGDKQ